MICLGEAPRNGGRDNDIKKIQCFQHHEGPFQLLESCLEDGGGLEGAWGELAPDWPPRIMLL